MCLCGILVIMDKRFVKILILVALGLAVTVDAQDGCATEVRVRKNTVYIVSSKTCINIPCPVRYCEKLPTIMWFKLSAPSTNYYILVTETDQITITQEPSTARKKEIISYLNFKRISNSDAGEYKCAASEYNFRSESHSINVSVSDITSESVNGTLTPATLNYVNGGWMSYIILACSAVLLPAVIVMLIIFLRVHRCTCKGTPIKHAAELTIAVFSAVTPTPTLSEHEDDLTV